MSTIFLFLIVFPATQSSNPPPAKKIVNDSNRRDLDRLLLRKPIPDPPLDKGRVEQVLRQVNADFKDLQTLNNKLQSAAQDKLDFGEVAELVTQIKGKAERLKSNLALPQIEDTKNKQYVFKISNVEDVKSALRELDRLIVSFTTNPVFENTNVVEIDLAKKASKDLGEITELSKALGRVAKKLQQKPQ